MENESTFERFVNFYNENQFKAIMSLIIASIIIVGIYYFGAMFLNKIPKFH